VRLAFNKKIKGEMNMNFAEAMKNESTIKYTENGAIAYNTTNNSLLDLFGTIGALRNRSAGDICYKFEEAFNEDPLLATKMMFYAGNIRGGLGERKTFRTILRWLSRTYPNIVEKNLPLIAFYNRFDSLFELIGSDVEDAMWEYIYNILKSDCYRMSEGKPVTLLAKWMPSENASSPKTKKLARYAIRQLGMNERSYRKTLSALRKYMNVTERIMSDNEWETLVYSQVPSYAMNRYRNAFMKHDEERFSNYISAVSKGEEKINSGVLYPYNLIHNYLDISFMGAYLKDYDKVVEEQWKSLPNFVGTGENVVVMADVSGSMYGRPLETSIGLALYFAEKNVGDYHGLYMTFTDKPHFISVKDGMSLRSRIQQVINTDVGYSTNLEGAFNEVLRVSIQNGVKNEDMPKAIIVVSDMEIDNYMNGYGIDFVDGMKKKFAAHGYNFPKLIFFNVEARHDTFLSQSQDIINISGQSTSSFKYLCRALEEKTSYDVMLEILNDRMYDCVKI
jgi:hypothetical protein